jgi:hypothetical protein
VDCCSIMEALTMRASKPQADKTRSKQMNQRSHA